MTGAGDFLVRVHTGDIRFAWFYNCLRDFEIAVQEEFIFLR